MAGKENQVKQALSTPKVHAAGNSIPRSKIKWTGWIMILMLLAVIRSAEASGGFTQTTEGNQTIFNQTDMKVYNEVEAYNIGENEVHIYNQPSADAVFLQRVTGADPSSILGKLTADGQVWVINPNGVLIGSGAVINTAGFLAAAMPVARGDFFDGHYTLAQSGKGGYVVNNGSIDAGNGDVILAGAAVSNSGTITAANGDVILASGSAMSFDFYGDGLINFAVDEKTAARVMGPGATEMESGVGNSGTISASRVLMTAAAAKDIFESVVNNEGIIEADSVSGDGAITLSSEGSGSVVQSGTLSAAGKGAKIEIRSDDDVMVGGRVLVQDNGTISIVADQNADSTGDLEAGNNSSTQIRSGSGNIELRGNSVRLNNVALATTGGGDVNVCAVKGYSATNQTVFDVTGSVNIDPDDPADHSTAQGSASIDWSVVSDSNVNFNPGADVEGRTINVESDVDNALAAYPNYGDIVFDDGQITGNDNVTLDANLGNIYGTDGGLVTSFGDAEFTAQLIGTVPTAKTVYHSDPSYPVNNPPFQETYITAGAITVDIDGTLRVNAESMVDGISGVLQGSAGYLDINPNTPGMIIWNGIYIHHPGSPMSKAYFQAIAQLNPYLVNELGGVEDLRKGSEYYSGGTPYEGLVLDNRARFDVFNDAVYVPYPDLITDLRLMKACDTDK